MFVDAARYDEASFPITAQEGTFAEDTAGEIARSGQFQSLMGSGYFMKEAVPHTKILQTESVWGALIAVTRAEEAPEYVFITSEAVTSAQHLQSTTAAAMAHALIKSSCIRSRSLVNFRFRTRLVMSDRCAAQVAAEKGFAQLRQGMWMRLFLPCEVHGNTGAQAKALLIVDEGVTGMIRLVLSLRVGGCMKKFRIALVQVILESLVLYDGYAGDEAYQYRRATLATFMGVGRRMRVIRSVLSMLPNGRWWLRDVVELWVPIGAPPQDRAAVAALLSRGLLTALASTMFRCFSRKRWANNDEAVGQLGIFESVHGLLSRTYRRLLLMMGALRVVTPGPDAAAMEEEVMPALLDAAADEVVAGEEGEHQQAAEAAAAREGGAAAALEDRSAAAGQDDFAKQNAEHRRAAWRWIKRAPLEYMTLIRCVMEPNQVLLRKQFYLSSSKFDRDQAACNLPGAPRPGIRDYRVLVCARGELDELFSRHQRALVSRCELWTALLKESRTEAVKCRGFRMASRSGAEVERLLSRRHRRPHFSLF